MNFIMIPQGLNYVAWPVLYYNPVVEFEKGLQLESQEDISNDSERKSKSFSIKLNISQQDLFRVGYDHKRNSWTEEEDRKLLELVKASLNWDEISKKLGNRNSKMCYSRYRRLSYDTKKRWSAEQQKIILQMIQKEGLNWKKISQYLPSRTARQIQQHYEYCLKPNLNKTKWTIQEDLLLIKLLEEYGAEWRIIEQKMGNRTQNQIKNRYYGRLLKISEQKQKNRKTQRKFIQSQKMDN